MLFIVDQSQIAMLINMTALDADFGNQGCLQQISLFHRQKLISLGQVLIKKCKMNVLSNVKLHRTQPLRLAKLKNVDVLIQTLHNPRV